MAVLLKRNVRRSDGGAVNFSGTCDENANRIHYSNLIRLAKEHSVNISGGSAAVLASAAGYGAFYLRGYGFAGEIVGEEVDPNSVEVARKTLAFFGHEKVYRAFIEGGSFPAYEAAESMAAESVSIRPLRNVRFLERDITCTDAVPKKQDVIICDFIHDPSYLGKAGTDNLSLRLLDLSQSGTLLSYRCGSEKDKLLRIGFEEVSPAVFIRKR